MRLLLLELRPAVGAQAIELVHPLVELLVRLHKYYYAIIIIMSSQQTSKLSGALEVEGRCDEHYLLDPAALRASAPEEHCLVGILDGLAEIGVNVLQRSDECASVGEEVHLPVEIVCQLVVDFPQVLLVGYVGERALLEELVFVEVPAETKGKEVSRQPFVVLLSRALVGGFEGVDVADDHSFQEFPLPPQLGQPLQVEDEGVDLSVVEDSDPLQERLPSLAQELPQFLVVEAFPVEHEDEFELGSLGQEVQEEGIEQ